MENIKILFIIDNMNIGGTQKVLIQLVEGLIPRGYFPVVVILNGSDQLSVDRLKSSKIPIYIFNKYNLLFKGVPCIYYIIKKEKIKIIQNLLFYSNNIGRVLGRISKNKIILSGTRGDGGTMLPWQNYLDKYTKMLDDMMIVNSKPALNYCKNKIGISSNKIALIYNGIEISKANLNNEEINSIKKLWHIPEDKIIIGTAGQLAVEKGHRYLIDAIKIILRKNVNVFLVIAGVGKLLNDLYNRAQEKGILENILFLGKCNQMDDFYEIIDIFALPSLSEGMPNVIMEAMSHGKPVIASCIGAIPELIDDGLNGILVPPGNADKLAEAILDLTNNAELSKSIGNKAKQKINKSYPLRNMIDSYDDLYRKMMNDKKYFKSNQ